MKIQINKKQIKNNLKFWYGISEATIPTMIIEELGELIQAISKIERKYLTHGYPVAHRDTDDTRLNKFWNKEKENVAKEIADVLISITELGEVYGISSDDIQSYIDKKLSIKYNDKGEKENG